MLTSSCCSYVKFDYHYNIHEWHGGIFEYFVDMAKYVYDVRKYSTRLKMFVKEYFCDVVKIYYRTFIHAHVHRLTFMPMGSRNNILFLGCSTLGYFRLFTLLLVNFLKLLHLWLF